MAEKFIEELKIIYPNKSEFMVMLAGTFDIIHTGHIYLINEAVKIGKVHIIIARDSSVEKYKGQPPILPENQRMELVRSIKGVESVRLGTKNGKLNRIVEFNPDIFLLGPNQYGDPEKYERELKKIGYNTIFRRLPKMDERYPLNSSTKIKEKIIEMYKSKN
ncbi:MAG: adenylyltransferase/cytidyltransferase family protein [Promethearchaeota archaeon]